MARVGATGATGPGWTLELKPGWLLQPGPRQGDLVVTKGT